MNKAILIGWLTADPEMRQTQNGVAYCGFTVAIDRKFTDQNGNKQADFIACVAWRERAEFIQKYFAKGRRIGVEGTIQTRNYQAQDGSKRYVTEVLVESVEFVDSVPNQNGSASPGHQAQQSQRSEYQQTRMDTNGFTQVDDEELPF